MTWLAPKGKTDLYETTHFTRDGYEYVGSAYWWFRLVGAVHMEDKCMAWPDRNSDEYRDMAEFAIANAALLGAEFSHTLEDGWSAGDQALFVGTYSYQGEAATAFLSMKGYWVCFSTQTKQWELVRI